MSLHEGPYADDLVIGVPLPVAPSITIDSGLTAAYQAICGDSLRLPLSRPDSSRVTNRAEVLVNPALALQVAIGQSTVATRLVIANLFYRDVALLRQVFVGDTLTTTVTPIALQLTRPSARGRRAKVALRIETVDQDGQPILRFERVALLPCRDADVLAEHGQVGTADPDRALSDYLQHVPGWDLSAFPTQGLPPSRRWDDPLAETVSSALELVRLTQNLAAAHRDARRGQAGKRLVYGGHAIGLAQASLSRACPGLVTILGWRACDHVAPVCEGDVLDFRVEVIDRLDLEPGTPHDRAAVVGFRVIATSRPPIDAAGADGSTEAATGSVVLDWTPVALVKHDIQGETER